MTWGYGSPPPSTVWRTTEVAVANSAPTKNKKNQKLRMATLMRCITSTRTSSRVLLSAGITEHEKAKKRPATTPVNKVDRRTEISSAACIAFLLPQKGSSPKLRRILH